MKKSLLIIALATLLSACSAPTEKASNTENIALQVPQKTEVGFVQLAKGVPYYVDSASVWVDDKQKHFIHFDTVLNLQQGQAVFNDKKLVSHSLRGHKTLDCKQQKLTHKEGHLYSEFWGKGQAVEAQDQSKYSVNLKSGSTLGIIGQILCANYYHH